ncbi:MAG: hypothetical protein QF824_03735 [Candidatus Woesearchaeota archaeon]|jgi:hypothetical protein|nr:hypothetical protein [Gammaproteobacteria bacterium]MDP7180355.1 hypothetical protein [Candidatus Woesearchaeota archaeon]|tara:strand:- start:349 stop:684 length:336 start_codon:yes stop_codon:yes gene_type:complete
MAKIRKKRESKHIPIEDILNKTKVDNAHMKRNVWIEGLVLALPLFVSFAFYANLVFRSTQPAKGALLSPGEDIQSLVLFVFIFIIIYGVFLIFQYTNLSKKVLKAKPSHKK